MLRGKKPTSSLLDHLKLGFFFTLVYLFRDFKKYVFCETDTNTFLPVPIREHCCGKKRKKVIKSWIQESTASSHLCLCKLIFVIIDLIILEGSPLQKTESINKSENSLICLDSGFMRAEIMFFQSVCYKLTNIFSGWPVWHGILSIVV